MDRSLTDTVGWTDALLGDAVNRRASDIHLSASGDDAEVRLRIDGLLEPPVALPHALGRAAITRLMVLAKLLTYRLDVPQEGRASVDVAGRVVELRVSVIPISGGMRCAVRLPTHEQSLLSLEQLALPEAARQAIKSFCRTDAGMFIVTGPAGSGKTTTIHALLRHLVSTRPELSLVSIEDPVERRVAGVAQVEVSNFGELTYERALRSILRQDPQVLALGEVRDAATAALAIQATLTGHRLICTMHASSAHTAIARLLEMGIEPFQISATLVGILNQRLFRRREGSGYRGRIPAAAWTPMTPALKAAILARDDAQLEAAAASSTAIPLAQETRKLIDAGLTDEAEAARVLGTL